MAYIAFIDYINIIIIKTNRQRVALKNNPLLEKDNVETYNKRHLIIFEFLHIHHKCVKNIIFKTCGFWLALLLTEKILTNVFLENQQEQVERYFWNLEFSLFNYAVYTEGP